MSGAMWLLPAFVAGAAMRTDPAAALAGAGLLVAAVVGYYAPVPLVVDPVCVSKHGDRLIDQEAVGALRTLMFPRATVITPNLDEAALLAERSAETPPVLADLLFAYSPAWVLIKGGHGDGDAIDVEQHREGEGQPDESISYRPEPYGAGVRGRRDRRYLLAR